MRIGLDVDNTLNTLEVPWVKWIAATIRPGFTKEQWTSWDIDELLGSDRVYDFLWIRGSFRNLDPQPGARSALEYLADNNELFAVTASTAETWVEKEAWLLANFPMIPKKNFIVCSRKGLLDLDVLVDDGLHNFAGFKGTGIVYDQPWNQNAVLRMPYEGPLLRACGWEQALNLINGLVN
jgi:5'(3')-deoxyribonucleotidase